MFCYLSLDPAVAFGTSTTNIHRVGWEQSVMGNGNEPSRLLRVPFSFVFKCEFVLLLIIFKLFKKNPFSFLFFLILKITSMYWGGGGGDVRWDPSTNAMNGQGAPFPSRFAVSALYASGIFPFRFVRLFPSPPHFDFQ